jgi:hypothetical protein
VWEEEGMSMIRAIKRWKKYEIISDAESGRRRGTRLPKH